MVVARRMNKTSVEMFTFVYNIWWGEEIKSDTGFLYYELFEDYIISSTSKSEFVDEITMQLTNAFYIFV